MAIDFGKRRTIGRADQAEEAEVAPGPTDACVRAPRSVGEVPAHLPRECRDHPADRRRDRRLTECARESHARRARGIEALGAAVHDASARLDDESRRLET